MKNTGYAYEYTSSEAPVDEAGKAQHFPWESLTGSPNWDRKVGRARMIRRAQPQGLFWEGRSMQYTDLMVRILDLLEGKERAELLGEHETDYLRRSVEGTLDIEQVGQRKGAVEGPASGDEGTKGGPAGGPKGT
jgi:hypothetical protein